MIFLAEQGIDRDRIVFNPISRNAAENARDARAIVQTGEAGTLLLVTVRFTCRATQSFEAVGRGDIIAYLVDYRTGSLRNGLGWNLHGNLSFLQKGLRELIGSIAYHILNI